MNNHSFDIDNNIKICEPVPFKASYRIIGVALT